jgi:phosphoglycolate phosphatase-like HAD superfamily hydrolase
MADHIVWDWNGTLFNDAHIAYEAAGEVFRTHGLPSVTFEQYRAAFTRPISAFHEKLFGSQCDPATFDRFDRDFHDAYRRRLYRCGLTADALAALASWHATGKSQSLLSMWRHPELEAAVRAYGITRWFTRIDGLSGPGGGRKAVHLARHLGELGISGDKVAVIGDSADDAHAAEAAGAHCVLYAGGYQDRATLEGVGVPVTHTLTGAVDLILSAGYESTTRPAG